MQSAQLQLTKQLVDFRIIFNEDLRELYNQGGQFIAPIHLYRSYNMDSEEQEVFVECYSPDGELNHWEEHRFESIKAAQAFIRDFSFSSAIEFLDRAKAKFKDIDYPGKPLTY